MDSGPHSREYLSRRRTAARRRIRRQRIGSGLAVLAVAAGTALALQLKPDGGQRRHTSAPAPVHATAPAPPPRARTVPARSAEPPNRPIPILMYHGTEAPPPGARSPDLWVPADRFKREMLMLRSRGYHAITLRAAYDYWKGRRRVPRKPIVISFDDGYRSQYTKALPVLRRLGWPGVLNLEVGAMKGRGRERITPAQVRGLVRGGWEIDAHTINHLDLTTLDRRRLRYEVADGRRQIVRLFGVPASFFCYPAGRYDAAAIAEVKRAGFLGATTTDPGLASPRELYKLKRVRAAGADTAEALQRKLAAR